MIVVDSNGYPVDPKTTSGDHIWFYVQKEGLVIATANFTGTISWAKVKRALKDHEKASVRKRRAAVTN